jgi:hypothetical protein
LECWLHAHGTPLWSQKRGMPAAEDAIIFEEPGSYAFELLNSAEKV